MTDNEKYVTDLIKALQIARASAFYSQLVWSPVKSVSKADFEKNPKLFDFVKLFFSLTKQSTCLKTAWRK